MTGRTRKVTADDLGKHVMLQVNEFGPEFGTWTKGSRFLVTRVRIGGVHGRFDSDDRDSVFNSSDVRVLCT